MHSVDMKLLQAVEDNDIEAFRVILISKFGGMEEPKLKKEFKGGHSPLHMAALYGRDDMVWLAVALTDVNSYEVFPDGDRCTALHRAVQSKKRSTVKKLLQFKATNPMLKGKVGPYDGTAWDWAEQMGATEMKRVLAEFAPKLVPTATASAHILLQEVLHKVESKNSLEETLGRGKMIRADIAAKEAELKTLKERKKVLLKEIDDLMEDKYYKEDDELVTLEEEVEMVRRLMEAALKNNGVGDLYKAD